MIIEYRDPPISYDKVINRRKTSQTHFHYQHELYYLLRGETKYLVGDDIYHLRSGDFIFVSYYLPRYPNFLKNSYNGLLILFYFKKVEDALTFSYRKRGMT